MLKKGAVYSEREVAGSRIGVAPKKALYPNGFWQWLEQFERGESTGWNNQVAAATSGSGEVHPSAVVDIDEELVQDAVLDDFPAD